MSPEHRELLKERFMALMEQAELLAKTVDLVGGDDPEKTMEEFEEAEPEVVKEIEQRVESIDGLMTHALG
jgi:hypothetical protein